MADTFNREPYFISFDERTELHSIVDRQKGLYLGHPTAAALSDGKTVFTVYPKGHASGQIVLKKSVDGGRTWSDRLPVPASYSTGLEIPTLYRLEDSKGVSRLIMFSGKYPLRISVSENDGTHFTELQPVGNFGCYSVSSVLSLGSGRYLAFMFDDGSFISGGADRITLTYAAGEGRDRIAKHYTYSSCDGGKTYPGIEKHGETEIDAEGNVWKLCHESFCGSVWADRRHEIYVIETADGGITWSAPRMICTHPMLQFSEPCGILSPDGAEISVLLRTENSYPDDNPRIPKTWTLHNKRIYGSYVITSRDGGWTWSEPREVCDSLCGDRHAARYLPDGRLFISLRDKRLGSDLENNWVAWIGSYEDMAAGNTGDCRILVKRHNFTEDELIPYDCAYPFIELMADNSLLLGSYGCWEEPGEHFILSMRIPIDELTVIPKK